MYSWKVGTSTPDNSRLSNIACYRDSITVHRLFILLTIYAWTVENDARKSETTGLSILWASGTDSVGVHGAPSIIMFPRWSVRIRGMRWSVTQNDIVGVSK